MSLIRNILVVPDLDHNFDAAFDALKNLTTSLDAISVDVVPVIVLQPPSLRATRVRSLKTSSSILGARIARLSALAGLISEAQRRLNHMRTRCQSALSPVAALPEEILRIIFPLALDAQPSQRNNVTRSTLLAVCRDWRAAALGQQVLWSSSFISDARDEQALRMAMGRYRGNGLQLMVKNVPQTSEIHSLIRTLIPRLKYLEWNWSCGLPELFSDVRRDPGSFGVLNTLVIDSIDRFASRMSLGDDSVGWKSIAFPQLKALHLRSMQFKEGLTAPSIEELSLFKVTLTGGQLKNLLSSVSNLRRLYISFGDCFRTGPSSASTRSIRLNSLEILSLREGFYSEATYLLSHVYAPKLLALTLEDLDEDARPRRLPLGHPTPDMLFTSSIDNMLRTSTAVTTLEFRFSAGMLHCPIGMCVEPPTPAHEPGDKVWLEHLRNLECVIPCDTEIHPRHHKKESKDFGGYLSYVMEERTKYNKNCGISRVSVASCISSPARLPRSVLQELGCPCHRLWSKLK